MEKRPSDKDVMRNEQMEEKKDRTQEWTKQMEKDEWVNDRRLHSNPTSVCPDLHQRGGVVFCLQQGHRHGAKTCLGSRMFLIPAEETPTSSVWCQRTAANQRSWRTSNGCWWYFLSLMFINWSSLRHDGVTILTFTSWMGHPSGHCHRKWLPPTGTVKMKWRMTLGSANRGNLTFYLPFHFHLLKVISAVEYFSALITAGKSRILIGWTGPSPSQQAAPPGGLMATVLWVSSTDSHTWNTINWWQ